MMRNDVLSASTEIFERVTMCRKCDRNVLNVGHAPQRVKELGERIRHRRHTAYVRRNRWQYVVAGQHHAVLRVEKT